MQRQSENAQEAPGGAPGPAPTAAPEAESASPPAPEPGALAWIVEDIFPPGEVHLIGGAPRAGKTAFECWMASHVLREAPFLGHATHRPLWWGAVILDRSASDRLYWWGQAGIDPLPYYCLTDDASLKPSALARMSRSAVYDHVVQILDKWDPPRGGVVTVDVANMLAADSRASYHAGFASAWQLSKLAAERSLTILALMHGAKQVGDGAARYVRPTDRIIAGTGFLGAVGTVAYLASLRESGNHHQNLTWEPHHHAPEDFELVRTDNGLYAVKESHERDVERVKPDDQMKAEDILPLIPYEPEYVLTQHLVGKVQELHTISRRTIYRWLSHLQDQSLVQAWRDVQGRVVQGKWCRPRADG